MFLFGDFGLEVVMEKNIEVDESYDNMEESVMEKIIEINEI